MGDHQVADAGARLELGEQGEDPAADGLVEARGRLVQDHDLRVGDQGPGHGDALRLAARDLARVAIEDLGVQAHLGDQLADLPVRLVVRHALVPQRLEDAPADLPGRIQRLDGVLEDHLDPLP